MKILNSKQILQRLSIVLAQIKVGNKIGNLLREICQIIYSLYGENEITEKVYNNMIYSKWILYLWILEIVKHLVFIDYCSILQIKGT